MFRLPDIPQQCVMGILAEKATGIILCKDGSPYHSDSSEFAEYFLFSGIENARTGFTAIQKQFPFPVELILYDAGKNIIATL